MPESREISAVPAPQQQPPIPRLTPAVRTPAQQIRLLRSAKTSGAGGSSRSLLDSTRRLDHRSTGAKQGTTPATGATPVSHNSRLLQPSPSVLTRSSFLLKNLPNATPSPAASKVLLTESKAGSASRTPPVVKGNRTLALRSSLSAAKRTGAPSPSALSSPARLAVGGRVSKLPVVRSRLPLPAASSAAAAASATYVTLPSVSQTSSPAQQLQEKKRGIVKPRVPSSVRSEQSSPKSALRRPSVSYVKFPATKPSALAARDAATASPAVPQACTASQQQEKPAVRVGTPVATLLRPSVSFVKYTLPKAPAVDAPSDKTDVLLPINDENRNEGGPSEQLDNLPAAAEQPEDHGEDAPVEDMPSLLPVTQLNHSVFSASLLSFACHEAFACEPTLLAAASSADEEEEKEAPCEPEIPAPVAEGTEAVTGDQASEVGEQEAGAHRETPVPRSSTAGVSGSSTPAGQDSSLGLLHNLSQLASPDADSLTGHLGRLSLSARRRSTRFTPVRASKAGTQISSSRKENRTERLLDIATSPVVRQAIDPVCASDAADGAAAGDEESADQLAELVVIRSPSKKTRTSSLGLLPAFSGGRSARKSKRRSVASRLLDITLAPGTPDARRVSLDPLTDLLNVTNPFLDQTLLSPEPVAPRQQ